MARFLSSDLWTTFVVPLFVGDFDALDALRQVSKVFRDAVATVRTSPLHGRHLIEDARRLIVARTTAVHKDHHNFTEERARHHAIMQIQKYMGARRDDVNTLARALLVAGGVNHGEWPHADRAIAWGVRRMSPELFGYLWLGKRASDPETRRLEDLCEEARWRAAEGDPAREDVKLLGLHVMRTLNRRVAAIAPEAAVALASRCFSLSASGEWTPARALARLYKNTYSAPTEASVNASGPVANPAKCMGELRLARYHDLLGISTDNVVQFDCRCLRRAEIEEAVQAFFHEHPGARIERNGAVATAGEIAAAIAAAGGGPGAEEGGGAAGGGPGAEEGGGAAGGGPEIEGGGAAGGGPEIEGGGANQ